MAGDDASEDAVDRTKLYMTVLMTPDMANFSGNVHGGALAQMLDQVAYACAARYAETYVVTLSVDRVLFRDAIHVGRPRLVLGARELHRPHLDGGRHQGGHREHPQRDPTAHQQLRISRWWPSTRTANPSLCHP